MTRSVSCISFAYPAVPTSVRSALASRLLSSADVEAFVLSTCLRLDIAVMGDRDDLDRAVKALLGDVEDVQGTIVEGEHAVHHLFRVAAGLESPVVGEPEILIQFRQALGAAKDGLLDDGLFAKVLEQAVSTGRAARTMLPTRPHESMAAVAAQLVGSHDRVAVFGSGLMATAVADALLNLPAPPQVTMVARHRDRVRLDDVEVLDYSSAHRVLVESPAVISATSASTRLVDTSEMSEILAERTAHLTLIDLAMPPDFTPPDGADIDYLDIDDLAARVASRVDSTLAAEHVADAAQATHRRLMGHHLVGPVIKQLFASADALVESTVERFAGRLSHPDDVEVLRQSVHTVARSLLAEPVNYLNRADNGGVDVVAEAFGVDD